MTLFLIFASGLFCLRAGGFFPKEEPVEAYPKGIVLSQSETESISFSKEVSANREMFFQEVELLKTAEKNDSIDPKLALQNVLEKNLENEIKNITSQYPIAQMAPHLAKLDRQALAFMVGIARKESEWGKRSPSKDGLDCFNYWGYKGSGSRGTVLGYACFGSAQEAVETVSARIITLTGKGINTPAKMVVWKCGSTCAGHDPASVKKWISDVSVYYSRIAYKN